jgi:hypothetical protein
VAAIVAPVAMTTAEGYGYNLIGVVIDRLDSGYSIMKPMDSVLELMSQRNDSPPSQAFCDSQ